MQVVLKLIPGFLISLLIAWGLVACGTEVTATPVPTTTPLAIPIATSQPASTITPLPIPTATLTPASSVIPEATATASVTANLTPASPVGDLPAPPNSRELNFNVGILQRAKNIVAPNLKVDLSKLQVGAFAADGSHSQPIDFFDYYRQILPAKGWVESQVYDKRFGIYFTKGAEVAAVGAIGVPDEQTILFLATFAPEVRKEIRGGEILIVLGQGSATTFEVLKRSK